MPRVFLAVGSNLGDRESSVRKAEELLRETPGIDFKKKSPVYETEPEGGEPQGKYLNAVWEIETQLQARELLEKMLAIEKEMGRVRHSRNEPRPIDLDILFYGSDIIDEPGLSVPHPRLHERWFVLKPLSDLCPDFSHPSLKKTVRDLLGAL